MFIFHCRIQKTHVPSGRYSPVQVQYEELTVIPKILFNEETLM